MTRIVYDINETNIDYKVYLEDDKGGRTFFPFYDIKIENDIANYRAKRWFNAKRRKKHYKFLTAKIQKESNIGNIIQKIKGKKHK